MADLNTSMSKTIDALKLELNSVRTGRANPALVEHIMADVYGMKMSLLELATITTPDAQTISIQAWDLGNLTPIRKAIEAANLGLNPNIDANNVIRIIVPSLTEERRKELVKRVHQISEDFKVQLRMARQDEMKRVENLLKNKEISEDDASREQKNIQDITNKSINKIDEIISIKEAELMQV